MSLCFLCGPKSCQCFFGSLLSPWMVIWLPCGQERVPVSRPKAPVLFFGFQLGHQRAQDPSIAPVWEDNHCKKPLSHNHGAASRRRVASLVHFRTYYCWSCMASCLSLLRWVVGEKTSITTELKCPHRYGQLGVRTLLDIWVYSPYTPAVILRGRKPYLLNGKTVPIRYFTDLWGSVEAP